MKDKGHSPYLNQFLTNKDGNKDLETENGETGPDAEIDQDYEEWGDHLRLHKKHPSPNCPYCVSNAD